MHLSAKLYFFVCLIIVSSGGFSQPGSNNEDDFRAMPSLQWKFSASAPIYSSPVADETTVYFGSLDSCFYAVDLQTGKMKWVVRTSAEIRSTALLANGFIYFISGEGKLYCLDQSGKQTWSFNDGSEKKYDFADYHQSSPVLYRGNLYFGMGDGFFYAIDESTGKLQWKIKTDGPVHTVPVIENGMIYFGSFDGNVYAVSIEKRSIAWKFKTVGHQYFPRGEVQGNPVLSKTCVIIGARDYNVYAIDKNKGYCHWNKTYTKGWVLVNTMKDSLLYMLGADERILACIDPESRKEIWKKNLEFLVFGKPVFTKSMLYAGTTMGKLHGIDLKTGEDIWTYTTDSYQKNRLNYLKQDDSYRDDIYSIIKSNEQFLDAEVEMGGIFSSPLISGRKILFTSTDGSLYCLKAGD